MFFFFCFVFWQFMLLTNVKLDFFYLNTLFLKWNKGGLISNFVEFVNISHKQPNPYLV